MRRRSNALLQKREAATSRKRPRVAAAGREPAASNTPKTDSSSDLESIQASLQRALEANRKAQQVMKDELQVVLRKKQANRRTVLRHLEHRARREEAWNQIRVPAPPAACTSEQVNDFFYQIALQKYLEENHPKHSAVASEEKEEAHDVSGKGRRKQEKQQRGKSTTEPTEALPQVNVDEKPEKPSGRSSLYYRPEVGYSPIPKSRTNLFQYNPSRNWDNEYFIDPLNNRPEPNADALLRQEIRKGLFEDGPLVKKRTTNCKLPKDALQRLLKLVEESTTFDDKDGKRIDWKAVQSGMNQTFSKQRTIWELVSAFAQHSANQLLQDNPTCVTTPAQDEFLFRYIALHGPQAVWDARTLEPLASGKVFTRLGNPVSSQQLHARLQETLVNPQLTAQSYWKAEEEKKLVLLMKIYQDEAATSEETDPDMAGKGRTNLTVAKAAMHFPDRTRQQVRRKWERSLDPGLDHQPFTVEEDALLRDVIKGALSSTDTSTMADLFRANVPNRKPHQVYARWLIIGTPEEILAFDTKQRVGQVPQDFHIRFKTEHN